MRLPDLVAINLVARQAALDTGEVVPITDLFDRDGDETDDPAEAEVFVAGPTAGGLWLVDRVDGYGETRH